jgi:hypothetical protein
MPQAASINNDDANAEQQSGQKFHRAKINHDREAGSTPFLLSKSASGFLLRFDMAFKCGKDGTVFRMRNHFAKSLAAIAAIANSLCPAFAQEKAGTNIDYWAVEDSAAREKLPLYQTIPAATTEELTPANGYPKGKTFRTWERSHGDNSGMRYSALRQINRANVTNLQPAWTYHSQDEGNALECNPIIAGNVMITPTPGNSVVGVNAATGA